MSSDDIAQRVAEARFTPVRMREGYDMQQVDDLLDQVVAAAEDPQAVAALVAGARFAPVRLREGYDMGDVDRFLASLVPGTGSVAAPAPRAAATRSSYDGGITETRSWWSRLFGPKDR